ncbi:hypothetical protein G6F56_013977 [Rhizopus delemar]|nr:hypothetical protein G6F56_013977 [Rhizopus delemar]
MDWDMLRWSDQTDNFGTYRAVDFQDFLLVVVPLIICPMIASEEARNRLIDLVDGCKLSLLKELTSEDCIC